MGEVDDVEKAEDDGEAEAEHGVERAIDQPQNHLPEQCLRRNAEQFEHGRSLSVESDQPFFTNGQFPWSSGRNASAAGMVARSL